MKALLREFQADESGVTAVEYGIIIAVMGTSFLYWAGQIGLSLNGFFLALSTRFTL